MAITQLPVKRGAESWLESGARREVHPALQTVFPGGLKPEVYTLSGATSVGFGLLISGWCGVVGLPELGIEAACEWGVDLKRLVLVPDAGIWLETIASLIDGLDVVLAAAPPGIAPHAAQRLVARLRSRQTSLIVLGEWPRAYARIHAKTAQWNGLGQGFGCLESQQIEVSVSYKHGERKATLIRNSDGLICEL